MASLTLSLDTTPPVAPSAAVLGPDGEQVTLSADQVVHLRLTCSVPPEVLLGEFKVWGDVDPAAIGSIQPTEEASAWTTYSDVLVPVRLSAGGGVKGLYGRLRDDLRNQTPVLFAQVIYDPTHPSVSVVSPPDRTRLSTQPGFRTCSFAWSTNTPFEEYVARAVPAATSSHLSGTPIGTASGSAGVSGSGAFPADTPITTTVDAADLAVASPGDGPKTIKVFVRDSTDRWSL